MNRTNYTFFSILITYVILIIVIFLYMTFFYKFITIPVCPIYKHFGIFCPACGSTRAVIALSELQIVKSFMYNPIILYTLITSSLYLIVEGFHIKIHINWKIVVYIGLIILLVNFILKNTVLRIL